MILMLFLATLAFADGGCMVFDLHGKTEGASWSELVLGITKGMSEKESARLPIISRRADGKSWSGTLACARLDDGAFSCYGDDDRGSFRLEMGKSGPKLVLTDPLNVGYEGEPGNIVIRPKGEEIEIVGAPCGKKK